MLSNLSETTVSLVEGVLAHENPHQVIPQLMQMHGEALSEIHTPIEILKFVAKTYDLDDNLYHALQFSFLLSIDHLQSNLGNRFQDQRNLMLTNALFKAITQLIEQPAETSRKVLFLLLNLSAFGIVLPSSLLSTLHEKCDNTLQERDTVHVLRQEDLGFMFGRLAEDQDLTDSFLVYQALVEPLLFFSEEVVEGFVEQLFIHENPKLHDAALFFLLNEHLHIAMAAITVFQSDELLAHATMQDLARLQIMRHWIKDSKRIHLDQAIAKIQRQQPQGTVYRGNYQLIEAKATLADYSESYLVKLSLQSPDAPTDGSPQTLYAYCHFALRSGIENIQLLHSKAELVSYEQMMQESELEFKTVSEAQLQQMFQHTLSQQSVQCPPAELLHIWQCYQSDCFLPQAITPDTLFHSPCDNPNLFSRDELIEQWILLDMDYHSEFTPENTELLQQHLIHALIVYQGQQDMMVELKEVADVFSAHGDFYATSLGNSCHAHMMETASELSSLPEDFSIFENELEALQDTVATSSNERTRPENYWLLIKKEHAATSPSIRLKINDAVTLPRLHQVLSLLLNWPTDTECTFEAHQNIFTSQPSRYADSTKAVAELKDAQLKDLFISVNLNFKYFNNLRAPEMLFVSILESQPLKDLHLFPTVESYATQFGNEDTDKTAELQEKLDALFRGQLH